MNFKLVVNLIKIKFNFYYKTIIIFVQVHPKIIRTVNAALE